MEEQTCPATPPLSRCPDTPPPAGSSKSSPSKWSATADRKEKSRTPTPNRPSSPENCAICLGPLTNKSFTNSCCHQFCFVCLLEWSKVKAECPLCKVAFDSIIHNVRSQDDYDQYHVVKEAPPRAPTLSSVVLWSNNRASVQYHYRNFSEWMATGIGHYRSTVEGFHNTYFNGAIPNGPPTYTPRPSNPNGTSAFRRSIYQRNLWARRQPDITGRYRECSPEFYRLNPAQLHRLIPFLNRELNVLLDNHGRTAYVMEKILELLPDYSIQSTMFRSQVARLIGHQYAPHFCHELRAFASSPYDMVGYDRAVQYHPNGGAGYSIELDDIESSDADASDLDDDDVLIIENNHTASNGANSSISASASASTSAAGSSETVTRSNISQRLPSTSHSHISHTSVVNVSSDSESDVAEDVQIVGFVKPRSERTPEVITLSSPEHPGSSSHPAPGPPALSGSPELSDDLICINLGNSSSAEHKWHGHLNELSSDEGHSSSYPPPQSLGRLRKNARKNFPTRFVKSSETSQSSSSSEEDERIKKRAKRRKSKGDELRSRKHVRSGHSRYSDKEDDSQPSTSRGRTRRKERRDRTSSPKSTSCSKNSTLSSRSPVCSGSDSSPPRSVIRSAIVQNSCSRRYSSDEKSPARGSSPKLRNIIVTRTTTDEGHDSWRVSGSNTSQDSYRSHSGKHERHRSSHHHSKKKKSSRKDRKRRDRSRSPDMYSKSVKKIKTSTIVYSSDDSDSS